MSLRASFLAAIVLLLPIMNAPADPITPYRWKKRLVVLLAPRADDGRATAQQAAYDGAKGEYDERDLTFLREVGEGPLHRRFGVPPGDFRVLLIGKDGHTALERSNPVANDDLFRLIDSMPMRRDEVRRKAGR